MAISQFVDPATRNFGWLDLYVQGDIVIKETILDIAHSAYNGLIYDHIGFPNMNFLLRPHKIIGSSPSMRDFYWRKAYP